MEDFFFSLEITYHHETTNKKGKKVLTNLLLLGFWQAQLNRQYSIDKKYLISVFDTGLLKVVQLP